MGLESHCSSASPCLGSGLRLFTWASLDEVHAVGALLDRFAPVAVAAFSCCARLLLLLKGSRVFIK
jgi:hypothetical protein